MSVTHTPQTNPKLVLATLVGNALDKYDTALFAFLAPVLAPLFFPKYDPVAALIMTYGMLSISWFTRPLGAFVFGRLVLKKGPQFCLGLSLIGLSMVTGAMGFLPTHAQIGVGAPILMAVLKITQGFFAAGETTIASQFMVRRVRPERQSLLCGILSASTIAGELIASAIALWVLTHSYAQDLWRWPFFLSFLTGAVGLYLRLSITHVWEKTATLAQNYSVRQTWGVLWYHRRIFLALALLGGAGYLTYAFPFVFMNTFVPLVSDVTLTQMMSMNNWFLGFDMIMLPMVGILLGRFAPGPAMLGLLLLLLLGIGPCVLALPGADIGTLWAVRLFIVMIGVSITTLKPRFIYQQLPGPEGFLVSGMAYALGSELLGRSSPALCLFLWYYTQSIWSIIAFLTVLLGAVIVACLPFTYKTSVPLDGAWQSN